MNHLNRIYHTAIALQGARNFKTELAGLGATPQGDEFAKALADAAVDGIQPATIAEQVMKAMAGNEEMALQLLESVEEVTKAHIEQHTRTLPNGKTVNVRAYETSRTGSMKATALAHGATFHAMRARSPEAHENAARMHEDAAKQHGEAHEIHPRDVPEVGQEHANLKGQHQMAAEYHRNEAQQLRSSEEYSKRAGKAKVASELAEKGFTVNESEGLHRSAAQAHRSAHEVGEGKGHDAIADKHDRLADAAQAVRMSANSPHRNGGRNEGHKIAATQAGRTASERAYIATKKAANGSAADHEAAAEAHADAADHHLTIHGEHESDENGHHGQIAMKHLDLHAYHTKLAKKGAEVAKAEGTMTSTPTTTDLAKKEGGEALAVEGRPKEDDEDEDARGASMTGEIGKAHVEGHTREVGGKVVQVKAYETATRAADIAKQAHAHALGLTSEAQGKALKARDASHAASEASHGSDHAAAADAHRTAAAAHEATGTAKGKEFAKEHQTLAEQHDGHAEDAPHVKASRLYQTASAYGVTALSRNAAALSKIAKHSSESAKRHEDMGVNGSPKIAHLNAAHDHDKASFYHHTASERAKTTMAQEKHFDLAHAHAGLAAYHREKAEGGTVAKAHVEQHTRTQGGKMVQVSAYETHFQGSMKASTAAHSSTAQAKTPQAHTAAAAAHMKAADVHRAAAEYAPEGWQKQGHIDNANLHAHYAQAHHAKAKAADQKADTGVDQPKHTPQDIKELENHEDYQGFGYLGHSQRSEASDKALADAANRAGADKHDLAAWALSAAGRHGIHEPKHEGDHEKMVAHYQRQLTDAKVKKGFGLKEYADDLKSRKVKKEEGKGTVHD